MPAACFEVLKLLMMANYYQIEAENNQEKKLLPRWTGGFSLRSFEIQHQLSAQREEKQNWNFGTVSLDWKVTGN